MTSSGIPLEVEVGSLGFLGALVRGLAIVVATAGGASGAVTPFGSSLPRDGARGGAVAVVVGFLVLLAKESLSVGFFGFGAGLGAGAGAVASVVLLLPPSLMDSFGLFVVGVAEVLLATLLLLLLVDSFSFNEGAFFFSTFCEESFLSAAFSSRATILSMALAHLIIHAVSFLPL